MLEMLSGASRASSMQANNPIAIIGQVRQLLNSVRGQDPQRVTQAFAQRNPQFADFLRQNQGKSPEQIASECGIDMNMVRELMR